MRRSQPGNINAIVISGGDLDAEYVLGLIKDSHGAFIAAVERGYLFCLKNGIKADLVIGDFDTVGGKYADLASGQGAECIKMPCEKDITDTCAAVEETCRRGYTDITVTGCFGGRFDHSVANIKMLEEMAVRYPDTDIVLVSPKNRIRVMSSGYAVRKEDVPRYISFFALGGPVKGLTLKGFKYELKGYDLQSISHMCVSNEVTAPEAIVSFDEGMLLEVVSED